MKKLFTIVLVVSVFFINDSFAQQKTSNSPAQFFNSNTHTTPSFIVKKISYQIQDPEVLTVLSNNERGSFLFVGKKANMDLFIKEKNRVYKLVAAIQPQTTLKDIYFKVDTTQESGSCNVIYVVKNTYN